jgi:transcriptional regulator with XRE-family HTH domain
MKINEKIKKLRKERQWSQADLADKLNVHLTHISRLETGKYPPSLELLKKLAQIFEVTTDYLLFDSIDNLEAVNFQKKPLYDKIKMLETLEEPDQKILLGVINTFLAKQQMWNVLNTTRSRS